MFAYLRGAVASTGSNYVVLDVGGIGFRVMTSWQTLQRLPTPGEFCPLYTHFSVREDAMELFGFDTETELECYEMLTAVTGVGPRVALAILSEFSSTLVSSAAMYSRVKWHLKYAVWYATTA